MSTRFRDRTEAGKLLAKKLLSHANCPEGLVLGLPRGGVPVAWEVAKTLNLPLDICLVRKLGVPGQPELAMGAIASGGVCVLNEDVVNGWGISRQMLDRVTTEELKELQRRDQVYRGDRPAPVIQDRTVILVDDGIATGSTMRAAIAVLRQQNPSKLVVAIPVAPLIAIAVLRTEVDEVVCVATPEPFHAIGLWYEDFSQTTDEDVCQLLQPPTGIANSTFQTG